DADLLHVLERSKGFKAIWHGDLAAQMDPMLGAQSTRLGAMVDRLSQRTHVVSSEIGIIVHPAAKDVEDGRDAGGSDLRVMCLNCRHWIPANARSRRIMLFQVIRVKLNQARN